MRSLTDFDWVVLCAFIVISIVTYLVRRHRSEDDIRISEPAFFGTIRGVDVGMASSFDKRRYVTLEYQEGEDPVDVQVILTTQQASRLAQFLRIAATDGRTLTIARAKARKR